MKNEELINNQNNEFQKKVELFIETNNVKDLSFNLLNSLDNGVQIMEDYNFELLGEEVINSVLSYDKKVLNVLYFETSNGKNNNNSTSKTIKLPGMGRFSVYNFIEIAKEKGLKEIIFDIKESELGFYNKMYIELQSFQGIKWVNIEKGENRNLFIITL